MYRHCSWAWIALMAPAWALGDAPPEPDALGALRDRLNKLELKMEEKDRRIGELEQQVKALKEQGGPPAARESPQDALDAALKQLDKDQAAANAADRSAIASVPLGSSANLKLIDISMDVLFNAGTSTASDKEIQNLQGGGHDPKKRGFTLSQAELSFAGAVDPYINGEAHLILFIDPYSGETGVELEEAFATTKSLPAGLQLKAGQFFSKFGLINPTHPHAWDWIDQPIINSRVFGGDGMRQAGVQASWLTPLPWYSELFFSVQNATGEQMPSFFGGGEEAIAGRPPVENETRTLRDMAYLARWFNSWELGDEWSLGIGGSGVYGPNTTGPGAETWIYGADLKLKWKPASNERGWPFVIWQSEVIGREYEAAGGPHPGPDGEFGTADDAILTRDDLHDLGFYTQLLYGLKTDWIAGIRYEYATGSGNSINEDGAWVSHNDDPFRDDRHRISPLVIWQPTHFSRLRLQYNYDHAAHLDHDAHSVWFGMEFLFGAHPAHSY